MGREREPSAACEGKKPETQGLNPRQGLAGKEEEKKKKSNQEQRVFSDSLVELENGSGQVRFVFVSNLNGLKISQPKPNPFIKRVEKP